MKKLLFLTIISLASVSLYAQTVEVTPLYGYAISGTAKYGYGKYDVKDNPIYGAMLDVWFAEMTWAEITYQRVDTRVQASGPNNNDNFAFGVEHYHAGVLRDFKEGKVVPFAKLLFGASRYWNKEKNNGSYWRFSPVMGVGAKFYISDMIGLRLHTNLTLPLEFSGVGLGCGIGTGGAGCGGGVAFNVPVVQWDITAGLIIRIPE